MSQKLETLLLIYMQKDMGNPIKPMRMTENESKWLIWLIFVNFFEKWLILKTHEGIVLQIWFTHRSKQNMLFSLRNGHCI